MKIIGITGGVGSGKSQILAYMKERYGAAIYQADQVAWELQKPGQKCYQDIVAHFGTGILNADNTIKRNVLGEIVFSNKEKLLALNEIMHPAVKEEIHKIIRREKDKGTDLFVLEAALLIEEHYDEICDELWYINADEQIRCQRLKESREYSDEKIKAIMKSQLSEEIFQKACNKVIDNSGTFEKTCMQVEGLIKQLGEN